MNTTRTWTHAVITAAFAITAAGLSSSEVLSEPTATFGSKQQVACADAAGRRQKFCWQAYLDCKASKKPDESIRGCTDMYTGCEGKSHRLYERCIQLGPGVKPGGTVNPTTPGVVR